MPQYRSHSNERCATKKLLHRKRVEQWWSLVYRGDASVPLIGLSVRTLERRIKRAIKMVDQQPRSGQAADSLHHLRHWYANRLYQHGLPVSDIARLLGHSSPATTMGSYVHVLGTSHIKTTPTIETDETVRYIALATWCGVSDKHLRNLLRLQVGQNYTQGHVPMSVAFVFLDELLDGQHSTSAPRWGDHAPSDFSND